jgi:biotin synthase
MDPAAVVAAAIVAKAGGAERFCMGAAWREVRDGPQFESVLASVRGVSALGLEVCCTLGMVSEEQATRLKAAGCAVYNHNLDTSREFYPEIITTRTYDDRLNTLAVVRAAGLQVCSGGILGMGETVDDRLKLLVELASLDPQPDSVPINALVPVAGTPLAEKAPVDPIEFVRTIATARILMPKAMVRLSAGRTQMSDEMQALCFVAGANSIFLGEKLLTTPNPNRSDDLRLLSRLGMHPLGGVPAERAEGTLSRV